MDPHMPTTYLDVGYSQPTGILLYLLFECNDEEMNILDLVSKNSDKTLNCLFFFNLEEIWANNILHYLKLTTRKSFTSKGKLCFIFHSIPYPLYRQHSELSKVTKLFPNPGVSMIVKIGFDTFPRK